LILALLFFTLKGIKPIVKLSYSLFFTLIISSFYLQPLNLFWQGMHAPNMFLYRYAWVLSIGIIYLAAETVVRLDQINLKHFTLVISFLFIGFLSTYFFKNHYDFLVDVNFLLTLEFLIAYFILFIVILGYKSSYKWITSTIVIFSLLEVGIHTYYQVQGLSDEWHFPSRSNYEEKLSEIDSLVKSTAESNDSFYRMERLLPQTGNDSMKFNYNGISQFSSIRNRASGSALDKLGFRSDGTNLNLRYQNNTIIADSLFGIKYNLATSNPNKYGFSLSQSLDTISLYENSFSQGLAILTDGVYKDVKFTNLTLDNQTNFLNQLTGVSQKYYYSLKDIESENTVELGNRMTVNKVETEDAAKATFIVAIPANSQVYLNLPNITFSNENQKRIIITVNNQSSEFTIDNAFSFFNIGNFSTDTVAQIEVYFPENNQVSFDLPQFYRLDLLAFQQAVSILQEKNTDTRADGNRVTVNFETSKEASILLTLPFDKGWSATIDGKPVDIQKAQNGFMKVNVEPGQTKLVLTFIPQGFYVGLLISFGAIFVFCTYQFLRFYYLKNREK